MKPCTEVVPEEAPVRQEGCASPRERATPVPDGGRVPVWEHVINTLLACHNHERADETHLARPACRVAACVPSPHAQIEVIERLTDSSIAVLWQDATRCRYADQVWISCRARMKGRCALSGSTIRRGDLVFKPRVRSRIPANADAMILASAIARIPSMAVQGDSR